MIKNLLLSLAFITSICFADLLKPTDNAYLRATHILFEWEQEPDAIEYNIKVFNSNNEVVLDILEESTVYIGKDVFNWNSQYYWMVRPVFESDSFGEWTDPYSFSIGESRLINLDVDNYNPSLLQDGVMVYSQFQPYFIIGAVDIYGNEIWNTDVAFMNHVSEFGELYGIAEDRGVKFNFNHEYLWISPENTYQIDSHEVKQIPNGNFMAFATIFETGPIPIGDWTNYFQILGYAADGVTNEIPWLGLRIVEFDKDTGEEVWSWNPFDYFSMDDSDLYGGTWWDAAFTGFFDWMHSNAFHFDDQEGAIYVSHRHLSRISKIAYPSGDVIWNMGLPAEYETGDDNICTDLLFSFQHHIQLMDNGDLLFFDNGNISDLLFGEDDPITRIRRIRVIDDSYCETVWQYDLPPNLHGLGMGSVQLLENNNYFIYTFGSGLGQGECSLIEINQNQDMVWKATSQNPNTAWYRSYKIPSIYPDAFSVLFDGYTIDDANNPVIQLSEDSIDFSIYNKGGYNQLYSYSLVDVSDGDAMFNYQEGTFDLEAESSLSISIPVDNLEILESDIYFRIWPTHHSYSMKELNLLIKADTSILGDINFDDQLNILDIVSIVDIILNDEFNSIADLNSDGLNNILDIVQLVSLILE
tara:strand:- start:1200 stop:3119 length:1920 start_codon:yes stop_codon:yes gene_type:complete